MEVGQIVITLSNAFESVPTDTIGIIVEVNYYICGTPLYKVLVSDYLHSIPYHEHEIKLLE